MISWFLAMNPAIQFLVFFISGLIPLDIICFFSPPVKYARRMKKKSDE